jgi:predicted NUDIX family NTP pyrophosphohydrolase
MPVHSAGILLYREVSGEVEVLLVHPGGPYYAKRNEGVWSIPKGILEDGEEGLKTAKREFKEELGLEVPADEFLPLKPIKQKGNKIVHAWAAKGDLDAEKTQSNTFRMEYPYKSGNWIEVPEVDRTEWFSLKEASVKILPAQQPLLDELASILSGNR